MTARVSNAVGRIHRPTALSRFRSVGPVLCALAMGCFTYADVPRTSAVPGRDVRVDLNADGRAALTHQIGAQVRTVSGRLSDVDTSGLTVAMAKTTVVGGEDNGWHGEKVVIPYQFIQHAGERSLSKGKTVALLVLAAGAVTGIVVLVGHASTSSVASGAGPHPAQ